ncbi:diadenylate cyclase [Kutzneria sp. NPDC052558]|uniref:diadenylate cyclase n=1 Tax=Kutzneria sp. NPDC052558 TaxID=3364121 RepID=UPI0037CC4173
MEVPAAVRDALANLALDTPLRQGIERVSAARVGGLFVLGDDESVAAICEQGFPIDNVAASAENIAQFSKMDLALVLSTDRAEIRRFNTVLAPRSTVLAQGIGARHVTAARTARDIKFPVVAVSEETGQITLFVGEHMHKLSSRPVLLSKATINLLALHSWVQELTCAPPGIGGATELIEQARRAVAEIDTYLLELGDRGNYVEQVLDVLCYQVGLSRMSSDPNLVSQRVPLMYAVTEELDSWYDHALNAADQTLAERPAQVLGAHDRAFPRMSFDTDRDAVLWYEETAVKLLISIRRAASNGDPGIALRRALAMLEYFYRRKPWTAWIDVLTLALLAARELGDKPAEASLLTSLGVAQRELHNYEDAFELWRLADVAWRDCGDRLGRAELLNHLAYAHDEIGDVDTALRCAQDALDLIQDAEDERLRGKVLNNLSGIRCRQGEFGQAVELAEAAMRAFDRTGYRRGFFWALSNKANACRDGGRHDEALECYRTALSARLGSDDLYGTAITRADLGLALHAIGDADRAREELQLAEAYFRELGDPRAAAISSALAELDSP